MQPLFAHPSHDINRQDAEPGVGIPDLLYVHDIVLDVPNIQLNSRGTNLSSASLQIRIFPLNLLFLTFFHVFFLHGFTLTALIHPVYVKNCKPVCSNLFILSNTVQFPQLFGKMGYFSESTFSPDAP